MSIAAPAAPRRTIVTTRESTREQRRGVPVLDRSTRVAVRAAYPAVRAGLVELLRRSGFDVDEGTSSDRLVPVDVLVVDLAGETPFEPSDVATVYLAERGARLPRLAGTSAYGWLPRD